jgi:hypothetical protein
MPWDEALTRAGSFDALRPRLQEARILARHNGLYRWSGGGRRSGPGDIQPDWWTDARVDLATGRVIFAIPGLRIFWLGGPSDDRPPVTSEVFAVGIELERAAVERLFPVAAAGALRHAGGRDPDNDWEGAAGHVDAWVAAHGPLPRHKDDRPTVARAVELMTEWFEENQPPAPPRESIYRWLRKNPHPAWWGL